MLAKRLQSPIVSISIDNFAVCICSLPLFSFLSCVAIALVWHFDETTRTHCKFDQFQYTVPLGCFAVVTVLFGIRNGLVPNYLPSISAAIGGYMPEKIIWRVGIALHCLPRLLLMPYVLHKYFKNTLSGRKYNSTTWWFWLLNLAASISHAVENGALIILTYISSTDNFDVHEGSFIVFMVSAMSFMLQWCILFRLTATRPMTSEEYTLFKRNLCTMSIHCCSFALAVYFYFRHNWYCELGVYTLFALCEYITVVSNIAFHWHCTWIFTGAKIALGYFENSSSKAA